MKEPWNFEDPSCKGIDTDIFFPQERKTIDSQSREFYDNDTVNLIRAICNGCVERKACLQWALHHELHGIWAGTTPSHRQSIRAKHNIILKEENSA